MILVFPAQAWNIAGNELGGMTLALTSTLDGLAAVFAAAPAPPGAPSVESMLATVPPMLRDAKVGLSAEINSVEKLELLGKVFYDAAAALRLRIANEEKEHAEIETAQKMLDEESGRLTEEEIKTLETEGE